MSLTYGRVNFDDGAAELADASTARTEGSFSKWNVNLARMQKFNAADGLYLSFAGQWTSDNLDSSQKMIAGGPYTVRAYDLGGIGLAWAGPHQWTAKTSLAARIGAVPVLITDPSTVRLWVELNRAF